MTDNETPAEVDLFEVAAESLLYGDPATAKDRLRDAIMHGAAQMHAHQTHQGIIEREVASSQQVAKKFAEENPDWATDPNDSRCNGCRNAGRPA
jgi:hypothetical protein